MAEDSRALRTGIQVVLAIIIVALAYWLYLSITEPYKEVERERALVQTVRDRMDDVRSALIRYERQYNRYPHTLDSLLTYVQEDTFLVPRRDSLLGADFPVDSLIYSPRTGRKFEYSVNDTSSIRIYYLKDPDSEDFIGSERPDVTRINAASWE